MEGAALPPLQQLDAELAALEPHGVLLLLVSRSDCSYCLEVRLNYLLPLLREAPPRLRLLELVADRPDQHAAAALAQLQVRYDF